MFKHRFLLVLGFLSLLLVTMAVSLPLSDIPASEAAHSAIQRGREAYAARWPGLGEYYQNRAVEEAERERSRAAEAARWEAMGKYYENQTQRQRTRAADAARWEAIAEYYNLERGRAADAARWTAMADYYLHVVGK